MSIESAKVLRNGKVLTKSSPHSPIKNTNLSSNSNMVSSSNSADEINRFSRNSPTNENSTQSENEERFNRLHDEMSMLKAMMEKIISQNEEREKQNGGSTATSSYAVGTSNTRSLNFFIWQLQNFHCDFCRRKSDLVDFNVIVNFHLFCFKKEINGQASASRSRLVKLLVLQVDLEYFLILKISVAKNIRKQNPLGLKGFT